MEEIKLDEGDRWILEKQIADLFKDSPGISVTTTSKARPASFIVSDDKLNELIKKFPTDNSPAPLFTHGMITRITMRYLEGQFHHNLYQSNLNVVQNYLQEMEKKAKGSIPLGQTIATLDCLRLSRSNHVANGAFYKPDMNPAKKQQFHAELLEKVAQLLVRENQGRKLELYRQRKHPKQDTIAQQVIKYEEILRGLLEEKRPRHPMEGFSKMIEEQEAKDDLTD
jgi:hypothetical protein